MRATGTVLLLLAALGAASPASAKGRAPRKAHDRKHAEKPAAKHGVAAPDADYAAAPSYRYANMTADACRSELVRRGVRFTAVDDAPGVLAPVRIPDGVGGIRYHTELPEAARATSPWEVFDCRLVLALDDLSKILAAHGVDDVVTFSGWRPPPKSWPKGKLAERHPGALAIDVKALRRASGDASKSDWFGIAADYHGRIGAESCGPAAEPPNPADDKSLELRKIICEVAAARIFTSMLTPNYNQAHFNHFHLEVTPAVKWRLMR